LESVTDNTPPQKEFAAKNNVQFPRLSDFAKRHLPTDYGVLLPDSGVANRSTFVIDEEGKIVYIEQGNTAIDPTGARRRAVARRIRSSYAGAISVISSARMAPHWPQTRRPSWVI
jgi:peroxiredoxin